MEHKYPVFTLQAECQDCYKCVRECPVKAIRIKNSRAYVVSELCISCGHCIEVCPVNAKTIRDDVNRIKLLLKTKKKIIASLAPSWVSEFPGMPASTIIRAIKELGLYGASETALGAQAVSRELSRKGALKKGLNISSACPSVAEWIEKYNSALTPDITKVVSPLLAHCKIIKQEFGEDTGVVFIGPCVAKKLEADANPELLNIAITFTEFRKWLKREGIDLTPSPEELREENFPDWLVQPAADGAIYPIEGGMIRTFPEKRDNEYISISGIENLQNMISAKNDSESARSIFIEALACRGGCINGPGMTCQANGLTRQVNVCDNARKATANPTLEKTVDIATSWTPQYIKKKSFTDKEIRQALRKIGKNTPDDQLNCSGCGYETCRKFAQAILMGNAEPEMCVSFMRKKAHRKANALLRSMPSAVVIVDESLKIIECNQAFARMFGEETENIFSLLGTLEDANLRNIVPFYHLFNLVLKSGEDLQQENISANNRLFNVNIFSIESRQTIGAVIQDVTSAELHREEVARNAKEVLHQNICTVQDIACRLGEHMASTEILLNAIAQSYTAPAPVLEEQDCPPKNEVLL